MGWDGCLTYLFYYVGEYVRDRDDRLEGCGDNGSYQSA